MNSRVISVAVAALVAYAAAATSGCVANSTGIAPPPTDTVCTRGALKTGDSLGGLFDSQNGCRTVDLFSAETTFANAYSVALTAGRGYLITMGTTDSNIYLRPSLELVNAKKKLIAYDSYYWPQLATLAFVADSSVTDTVRAATVDTLAGDLGYYFIKMQSCKVPLGPVTATTDSVTHADVLVNSDCKMPPGDFNTNDSSHVHLYSMYVGEGQARTLYWNAGVPLIVLIGPTYDTFATLPGSRGADSVNAPSASLEFTANNAGYYTIVVGEYHFMTSANGYTLTIGAQHTPTIQSSRSRSRPLGAQRRSMPLSGVRRGR